MTQATIANPAADALGFSTLQQRRMRLMRGIHSTPARSLSLELFICVAIIAVLMGLYLRTINGFAFQRATLAEVLIAAPLLKMDVALYEAEFGPLTAVNPPPEEWLLQSVTDSPTSWTLQQARFTNGSVIMDVAPTNPHSPPGTLVFHRVIDHNIATLLWTCGYAPAPAGLTVDTSAETTFAPLFLPSACRAHRTLTEEPLDAQ